MRGSHAGIQAALSQFLVQPGFIEKEWPKTYDQLLKGREWGDYKKRHVNHTDDQLCQMLDDAERFVARMETFLKERQAL